MTNLTSHFVSPEATLREVIRLIDANKGQIALVTDELERLIGTVSDGDIRRGLLRGENLNSPAKNVMCVDFQSLSADASTNTALSVMKNRKLRQIPGLDEFGKVRRLFVLEDLTFEEEARSNWVVVMAGGKGMRLRPLTQERPKPMLEVGGRPMLEILIEQFANSGITNVFLAVNYLKQQIMDYFGDGSRFGLNITYIEETAELGTAGALSCLPERPNMPVLVINGDVLSRIDYRRLIDFHQEQGVEATICVRPYETRIPFGVVHAEDGRVVAIDEKPKITHNVNTGIYMLNPEIIDLLVPNQRIDIPNVMTFALNKKMSIATFPVHEYWMDVGRISNLEKANIDWKIDK